MSGNVAGQAKGKLKITLNHTGRSLLHHKLRVTLKGTSANRVGSKVKVHTTLKLLKARP